jgi:hypothetical protein
MGKLTANRGAQLELRSIYNGCGRVASMGQTLTGPPKCLREWLEFHVAYIAKTSQLDAMSVFFKGAKRNSYDFIFRI